MSKTFKTTLALGLLLALAGCEEEVITVGTGVPNAPAAPVAPAPGAGGPGQAVDGQEDAPDAGPVIPSYRDEDFVEADSNRDPFRSYATMFQVTAPDVDRGGRDVIMPDTGIEEMRVIGIVTGVSNPRAMLVDREGVGHVVRRGEYVGRSEVVQAGGTEELPVTLNWRVDRIRPNEVVVTRQDPTAPNRPPLTRVLPLRDEEDELSSINGVRPVEPTASPERP